MGLNCPSTQVILTPCRSSLGYHDFDWEPQPGAYLEIDEKAYLVLERRHRYRLQSGRYQLHQVALYVQPSPGPIEQSLVNGRWVIGDATCFYNAHSEVLRCAIHPSGPCDRCLHYQPLDPEPRNC
jgi:Family of unknown function (DUF6464)